MGTGNVENAFKQLELLGIDDSSASHDSPPANARRPQVSSDKYLSILRQLPYRLYVNILVDLFFKNVAWQYAVIDRSYFFDEFRAFYEYSPRLWSDKQATVPPEVLQFPALLFQIVALAIQFLPQDYDRILDDLRMGRSFQELATLYSDLGIEIFSSFGRRIDGLNCVEARFLRVCFLKTYGHTTEAWHALGLAIQEAEEIGIHRQNEDFDSTGLSSEHICGKMWDLERERRISLNLFLWDM